jgi:hypothetical protein
MPKNKLPGSLRRPGSSSQPTLPPLHRFPQDFVHERERTRLDFGAKVSLLWPPAAKTRIEGKS